MLEIVLLSYILLIITTLHKYSNKGTKFINSTFDIKRVPAYIFFTNLTLTIPLKTKNK